MLVSAVVLFCFVTVFSSFRIHSKNAFEGKNDQYRVQNEHHNGVKSTPQFKIFIEVLDIKILNKILNFDRKLQLLSVINICELTEPCI